MAILLINSCQISEPFTDQKTPLKPYRRTRSRLIDAIKAPSVEPEQFATIVYTLRKKKYGEKRQGW